MKRIAINGFGRIGRLTFRNLLLLDNVEVVAINDLTDIRTLTHLLKHDSAQGAFNGSAEVGDGCIVVNGQAITVTSERRPLDLPWQAMKVDLVIECTGLFTDQVALDQHLQAGAGKVLLSAPGKSGIKTVVNGVNDDTLTADDHIVSNASCTTNCLAPMMKVLNDSFGVERAYMLTVHAYTNDQNILDAPHRDLRRARAAAHNIIPTTTGAATAVGLVLPELAGRIHGYAMRVPTITGSATDVTVELSQEASAEAINAAMKTAAEGPLKGILQFSTEPLVSSDIIGNSHGCIFDSQLTSSQGNLVKIMGWYDNEAGYAARLAGVANTLLNL